MGNKYSALVPLGGVGAEKLKGSHAALYGLSGSFYEEAGGLEEIAEVPETPEVFFGQIGHIYWFFRKSDIHGGSSWSILRARRGAYGYRDSLKQFPSPLFGLRG